MSHRTRRPLRARALYLAMVLALILSMVPQALPGVDVPAAEAHNLQTRMVYMFFDPETQQLLDDRMADPGWMPPTPLLQVGDELGMIIKVVPRDGTTTGVGGHIDFYVPNGVQVVDVGYVVPNGLGGYERVAMKGQSPIAIGAGPIGAKTTAQLVGLNDVYSSSASGISSTAVNPATGLHRGTIAGLYGDTGIFYATDPDTAYGSWQRYTGDPVGGCGSKAFTPLIPGKTITNNSGDVVVPCNKWDAGQLLAWGAKGTTLPGGTTSPAGSSAPIVDYADGRGNAPWGFASGVAGPESGYAWAFDFDEWFASSRTAADMRAAMSNDSIGPWKRIQYPGSRVSFDQPGLLSTVIGYANKDASSLGATLPLPETTDQLTEAGGPKAIRWAVGQLTAFRPEFAWVKIRVATAGAGITSSGQCVNFNLYADTFGGDAGGTDNGKDHLWRYYEPTEARMNMCVGVGKPATTDFVRSGTVFQYPVKVYNLQNFTLTNVVVRDRLGSGLTFLSAVPAQNSGPNPLVWNVGTLQPGQSFQALVTVRASSSGLLDNCVTVFSDQFPDGVSACDTTISGNYPFLVPTKTARSASVAPGGGVIYDVLIRNIGTGPTGSPVTVRELLPTGFTYDPTFTPQVTINGASVTATVNASNPAEPVFTVPGSILADRDLRIAFRAKVDPAATPGSYCNAYEVTQNGVPLTTGSLACVTVAGGQIGDTIFRDWNGNGVQDPGEEGMPGVTVTLQGSSPATSCFPTACTVVTDANGNYIFAGLLPGSYTVSVPNPGSGGVPSGWILTADPDGGPATTSYSKNLALNEVFLGADWGYWPRGTGVIGDQVFEDVANNGVFNPGTDTGILGVTVSLYEDANGDGVITPGVDALVATTTTGAGGIYSFTSLAQGFNYIAYVNPADPVLVAYFGVPFQASTPNPQAIPNLTGTYNDADFGFWRVAPGSIGDEVFLDNNANGVFDAGDTPLAGVTVNLYLDGVLVGSTSSGPDGLYLFSNLGPGNYQVVVDASDPDLPGGYFPTIPQYNVSLSAGQNFLTADFPFVSVLSKTVNLAYATPGQQLNFTLRPFFPGFDLLEDVRIIDPLPAGVSYVGGSANAGGVFGPYVSLPGEPGQDPVAAAGMGVYNNNNDTFFYRLFNADGNDDFTAPLIGPNMGTRIQMAAGASSPTTAERVIAFTHAGPQISGAIWNGTTWAPLPVPPANGAQGRLTTANLTANSNIYWGAAVAYEQSSGDLMVVWNDDTSTTAGVDDELRFATRVGSTWSAATSLAANNQPQNLRMAARPGSDQLALVYSTATGADYARIWSGTAWGAEQTLDTSGGSLTSVNVAFEAQSGRAMVVYGKPTATSVNLFYRIWDPATSSWSGEASITPPAGVTTQPQWVAIAADPFSNRIGVGVVTSGGRTWLAVWNGSAWVNVQDATTSALTSAAQNVAVAFETLSGDLLAAYGVNSAPTAQVRYRTWTWDPVTATGSWSIEASGPAATNGNPNVIMLTRSPTTDRVMMAINTSSSRANYVYWDGAEWNDVVLEAAGNTQVTGQQPMIFLWNRASATQSTATTVVATPITAAIGGSIVVRVELKSTSTIASVTPSLAVSGGSATCVTADTIPATVTAGVLKTFTYTCTPTTQGVFRFDATATAAGGYEFAAGVSNSVLVSTDGSSSIVTWNLGSNEAGVPGEIITGGRPAAVFGLAGANKKDFSRYSIASGAWTALNQPANGIEKGGSLTNAGGGILYASEGNAKIFYRYDITTNTWTQMAPASDNFNEGGGIQYLNVGGVDYVYAVLGNSNRFRRYNIASNSWTVLAPTPANVKQGGAITTDGTNLYVLQGDGKKGFWRYNVGSDTWTTLAPTPANVKWGGALTRVGGFIYAFRGDGKRDFWRYDIAANTWSSMAPAPGNVSDGGALTNDGSTFIYALQGKTKAFWRYTIATNSWTTLTPTNFPSNVGQGGALAYDFAFNAQGRLSAATAQPSLVSTGNTVEVKFRFTSSAAVNNVTPSALTPAATGGASAVCGSPTPASQNVAANSSVEFTWTCTVTAGANPGSLRFSASATGDGPVSFPSATSNSVLVSPVLTFSATVNSPAPASGVINNTGIMIKGGPEPNVFPSNTTQTATSGSIGDRVWSDLNGDGVQDPGEPGLSGVRVYVDGNNNGQWDPGELFDISDANGLYRIFNLPTGTYTVRTDSATYPAGFTPTTPVVLSVNLTAGQQYNDADFGLIPPGTGSIGDFIWLDGDSDGVQSPSEPGLPGIGVALERLVGSNWLPVATTTTDVNGLYQFGSLPAGQYRVTVDTISTVTSPYDPAVTSTLGAAMVPTYDKDGGTVSPNGVTPVTLATNATVVDDVDFGYRWGGSIGDFVWYDGNANGIPDAGDGLAPGCAAAPCGAPFATLVLYYDANANGQVDPGEGIIGTFETGVDSAVPGFYQFANLPPGNYVVSMSEQEIPSPVSGLVGTMVHTVGEYQAVSLAPNQSRTDIDFGVVEAARITGHVFHDVNNNGVYDPVDVPLPGVTVSLLDSNGNVVATAVTNAAGQYVFLEPPGSYTITYDPAPIQGTYPASTTPTSISLVVESGVEYNDNDFGRTYSGSVGDRVWNDANGNSLQDPGELGIPGVTVRLSKIVISGFVDVNGDGVINAADDGALGGRTVIDGVIYEGANPMNGQLYGVTVINGRLDLNGDNAINAADSGQIVLATTVTNAEGEYLFAGLADGTYVVTVVPATVPSGFVQTYDNFGMPTDNTGRGTVSGGGADLTADFGYTNPASYTVSGRVFDDLNSSGAYDPGEGLEDVTVCLYDSAGTSIVACTVTDVNGAYTFPGVPNGSYIVRVDTSTLPSAAYVQTVDPDGTLNNETPVTVSGANVVDRNFGYELRPGAISGVVCDGDGDGLCNDPGDVPVQGVTVILTWAGPDGILGTPDDVVYTTVTDVNGYYSFAALQPGLYQITKINPPQYPFSIADADGGNPNSITLNLAVDEVRDNQDFEVDPALSSIGDRVWLDENGNGVQDAGEAGIANVTVELFASDGTTLLATTVTDSNGNYIFAGLLPGNYVVKVDTTSMPAGLAANPTYDYDGIGTPHTTAVTLPAGTEFGEADFGYNWAPPISTTPNPPSGATGAIGDRVWVDANGDGRQDPGEPGLSGVLVELYSDPNGDGVYDNLVASTTTDANGNYIFDDVPAGAYVVLVNGGVTPTGYTQTGDPDAYGQLCTTCDNRTTQPVVLSPGDVFVNADFGYQPNQSSTIGDLIYLDLDGNGQHDAGEPGIPGVTVALLNSSGDVIATTTTDAAGNYTFPGLPAGTYTVWVNDTANVLGQLVQTGDPDATLDNRHTLAVNGTAAYLDNDFGYAPAGQTPANGLIGDTIFLDRNGNDAFDPGEGLEGVTVRLYDSTGVIVLATTTTDENGNYYFGGLAVGTYVVKVDTTTLPNGGAGLTNTVDPDGGTANQSTVAISALDLVHLDQDFGYAAASNPNTISGTIWNDVNANGVLNGSETGRYAGVTVVLYDADGNVVATTTTDASGAYSFTGLPDGSYTVDVTDAGNVLLGLWHSLGAPGVAGQSQTDPYTVAASGGNSYVVDYGYYSAPASLGDFVWNDLNVNGIQDSGEPGLAGVLVTLTILYPNGQTATVTTVTDANGFYTIGNLLLNENYNASTAGDPAVVGLPRFTLSAATPDGYSPTLINQGNGANDSDNPAGTVAVVVQGQTNNTFDFGFRGSNETYAINDINQTPVNVPVGGNVLTNDYDLEGDGQTVTSALADTDGDGQVDDPLPLSTPTAIYGTDNSGNIVPAGTITLNPDGTYTYTPAPNFTGTVPLIYTITDDNPLAPATDSATLRIEVVGDTPSVNDPPVAQDDTASTEQGVPVSGNVLMNDSDPDGDPIVVTAVLVDSDCDGQVDDPLTLGVATAVCGVDENGNVVPAGTLTINPDGTWTFEPNPGFTGDVPAIYTIEDPGGLSDDATLTITVVPNLGNTTFANDDANLGPQGVAQVGNILANDFDPEGDTQTVTLIDSNGDGTPDTAPTAGTPITIFQNGNPIGTLTVDPATGAYIWQPEPGFVGTAVIPYEVCDDGTPVACATATLYLTTLPRNNTYAIDDINQTPINTPVSGNVLTNDYDLEGDTQTVISALADTDGDGQVDDNLPIGVTRSIYGVDNGGNIVPAGTIRLNSNGTYTYTPALNFTGTVPLIYTIRDSNPLPATDNATLRIEVIGNTPNVNDPPVAQDDTASTEQGVPVSGNILLNDHDPDGDPITLTDVLVDSDCDGQVDDPLTLGQPTAVCGVDENGNVVPAGELTINPDGTWTFTPNPGFTGDVPAIYTIEDPGGLSDDATLTITIVPNLGNVTFANDDANLGPQGVAQVGNILANDFDPEGDTQTVTLIDTDGNGAPDTAPTAGTPIQITQNGNPIGTLTVDPATGAYIWQPAPTFVGTAVIPYEVCDDGTPVACATATLYLTTLPAARPDVTPIITAVPNVMTGVTQFNLTVRVLELNQVPTSGLITVRIPKDLRWTLAEPYNSSLTILGNIPVNNNVWSFSQNATHYIFQTTTTIPAGSFSTFGIRAVWDAGPNQGQYTITSQIDSFSGNETRIDNNSDAERVDYFIN